VTSRNPTRWSMSCSADYAPSTPKSSLYGKS
jgi:hypothetical protein